MIREPFPHLVIDGVLPSNLLSAVDASWPAADWPGWYVYADVAHRKRACDRSAPLPAPAGEALRQLALLPWGDWFGLDGLVPDLGLHGGGLHEVGYGGAVGPHLDADHHPRLGLARVLSVVCYTHPRWQAGWGGELDLLDETGTLGRSVPPWPGRTVAFAGGLHAVRPVFCPDSVSRRSLALFLYGPRGAHCRPRAQFLP